MKTEKQIKESIKEMELSLEISDFTQNYRNIVRGKIQYGKWILES